MSVVTCVCTDVWCDSAMRTHVCPHVYGIVHFKFQHNTHARVISSDNNACLRSQNSAGVTEI
jgi:hypothetical protein